MLLRGGGDAPEFKMKTILGRSGPNLGSFFLLLVWCATRRPDAYPRPSYTPTRARPYYGTSVLYGISVIGYE